MKLLHPWNVLMLFKESDIWLLYLAKSKGVLKCKLQWVFANIFMHVSMTVRRAHTGKD